jgi:3-(3-hydroxy-phenyl)propionate hydroxylase
MKSTSGKDKPSGDAVLQTDIAIIGCGPVGATLANLLGLLGLDVIVLERGIAVAKRPRAVHLDDEVMRLLQTIGLAEEMLPLMQVGRDTKFVDADERLLMEWPRPRQIGPQGWHASYRFHQPEFETVLRHGLRRWPGVKLRTPAVVVGVEQSEDAVSLQVQDAGTSELQVVRARYAVGCDGAGSLVRGLIGGQMEDLGFEQRWLAVDAVLRRPRPDLGEDSVQYCDPVRPATYIGGSGNRRRWEIAVLPEEDTDSIVQPANVLNLLNRWVAPDDVGLEATAVYTFRAAVALRWRAGRLMIAGDAAHLTPPFLGQGLCAGMRDAGNLAWKLGRILRGQDGDSLLDTYQTEREPHVREYIEGAVRLGRLINGATVDVVVPACGTEVARMASLAPRLGRGLCGGLPEPRGRLAPQPIGRGGKGMDDRIGYRFAAVVSADLAGTLPVALAAMLKQRDVPLVTDPSYGAWLDGLGVQAVLVRPDRYIFGAAHDARELAALVAAV